MTFRRAWGIAWRVALLLAVAAPGAAQQQVARHVIAGGGGRSTGTDYAIEGTAGQAAAGAISTGATYRLAGGYWAALPTDALFRDGFEDPGP